MECLTFLCLAVSGIRSHIPYALLYLTPMLTIRLTANNQLSYTVGVDFVWQAIMKEVDTSGDGKIDKQEFSKYFSAL